MIALDSKQVTRVTASVTEWIRRTASVFERVYYYCTTDYASVISERKTGPSAGPEHVQFERSRQTEVLH